MRKKISIGFISLALVLLLAGAVSVYELQRLRNQSEEIVALNMRNTELADRMLTALQSQNSAILRMIFSDATTPDAGYELGRTAFYDALEAASVTEEDISDLAAVRVADREYQEVVTAHLADDGTEDLDWFLQPTCGLLPPLTKRSRSTSPLRPTPYRPGRRCSKKASTRPSRPVS
ncbi:MAG: MCP four helix bundle domain-containing protein [Alistipes inops]